MKHKKKIIFFALCVIGFLAFKGWNHYMRISWDDHIIIEPPSVFLLQNHDGGYQYIEGAKLEALDAGFKQKIDIQKQGKHYVWNNRDGKHLNWKKTNYTLNEGLATNRPKIEIDEYVFTDNEGFVKIRMATSGYIGSNCKPYNTDQNTIITFKLSKQEYLIARTNAQVYENFLQHLMCNF